MTAARAVFAACPRSPDGCADTETILFAAGESIDFNASIIHAGGGRCGFKQAVQSVELKRCLNFDCSTQSYSLSSVVIGHEIRNFDPRILVSPNEVRKPVLSEPQPNVDDYDTSIRNYLSYVFTLTNVSLEDFGLYLVTVMAVNLNTLESTTFKRKYWVTTNGEHYNG